MKKYVLHIGTEKTATTSLQAFFGRNQDYLQQAGIWYPSAEQLDYCHRGAHFPLAASLVPECPDFITRSKHFEPHALFRRLSADFEARDEETVLLSAEHFSSRCSRPERVSLLGEILADRDVQVIVYVRPQHELLLSAYSTFLKSGGKKTIEHVAREQWLRPGAIYFNYFRMVKRWWDIFGRDRVTVRVFQPERLEGGDVYQDFLSILGVSWSDSLGIPERQNPPISKELADFLYLANQHFPAFNEGDRAGWELGMRFRSEVVDLFPNGRPLHYILCDSLKQETRDFFAPFNTKLARNARPDLDGELFVNGKDQSPVARDESENYFCDEFVGWVIEQWKAGRSLKERMKDAIR
jgi:hypothetical protein